MNKYLLIVFCILFSLLLLLFSFKIVLSTTSLTENQENTVNYLKQNQLLNLNYTSNELSHLDDVKSVMKGVDYLFYITLLILTLFFTYYKKDKKTSLYLLKSGSIATIVSLTLLVVFSLISFKSVFTLFHKMFFPQGNWMFSADSLLIQTFPPEFFFMFALKAFLLTIFLSLVILLLFGYFFRILNKLKKP